MKKIFGKNQIIVTGLAIIIAGAGYLNYTNNLDKDAVDVDNSVYEQEYRDDSLVNGSGDIEALDDDGEFETTIEPGQAILTNGSTFSDYMTEARLNREQTRSKVKEELNEIIKNKDASESARTNAEKQLQNLATIGELENEMETIIKAKGISDIIITINDKEADVIVCESEANDENRIKIINVIKRKAKIETDKISINPATVK